MTEWVKATRVTKMNQETIYINLSLALRMERKKSMPSTRIYLRSSVVDVIETPETLFDQLRHHV